MNALSRISAWLIAFALFSGTLTAEPLPRSILLLDQYSGPLPWVGVRNHVFRTILNTGRTVPISIYEEYLDLNRFASPRYKESLKLHLGEKYRDKPIGLIVAFGPSALEYAVEIRAALWPNTAVVFGEAAEGAVSRSNLAAGVTGTTINITFAELLVAARTLVPDLKHVALVGDSLDNLPAYRHFKEEIPIVIRDLDFIDLTGLSMADLKERVKALPEHTVIAYTTINLDRATGISYVPAEALSLVAEAANRPIVVSTETFVGRGAVGGFVLTPATVGQDAARLAARILDGEDASTIAVTTNSVNKPVFDGRQLQRWGISESALPPGSEVRFRDPGAWERYRWQIMILGAALIVQAGLISWLIYEHRRRSVAEVQSRNAMAEMTHLNRVATAGELSASIAHEVNQPLSGITLRASAALRWLAANPPDLEKVRNALTQIVAAGDRAGEIIGSLRAMFRKDVTTTRVGVNINEKIQTVLAIVRVELQDGNVEQRLQLAANLPAIEGDPVQLQQVILNLVINAIEAMQTVQRRLLQIRTEATEPQTVRVTIEDTGVGIDPANIDRVFQTLFTTKPLGMGVGLSICRSIIENHGGRIWVERGTEARSVFHFELPVAKPSSPNARRPARDAAQ